MDLHKLISGVIDSSREYWHFMADAPTFHDHLKFFEVYAGQANVLHVTSHHSIAVYIPDVSITMAWGLQWREDFKEPWIENFPDKSSASAGWLDLFFNNALVFRTPYVVVDGGRITLPLPKHAENDALHVTERACALFQLVDAMGRSPRPDFDSYRSDVERAGFTIVDEEWPTFPRKESTYDTRGVLSY